MNRLISAFVVFLLFSAPCLAQQPLVGTYKIVRLLFEIEGVPTEPMGKSPRGYLVITPSRYAIFYTHENRKPGLSMAEKAALWDTMASWSGPYRIDGDKMTISVDVSWNETWNGKPQVRTWQLQGNRLTLTNEPQPYSRDPSKMANSRIVFEKVE